MRNLWNRHRWGRRDKEGFTLVELLVALSIFSVIAVAIYATFSTGVRARSRGEELSEHLQMARVALNRMSQELRNIVDLSGHPLTGQVDTLSFPTLVQRRGERGRSLVELETITYWLRKTPSINSLMRKEERFAGQTGDTSEVISPVEGCRFSYYVPVDDGYEWWERWDSAGTLPLAVKIELKLKVGASDSGTTFKKTVPLPLSEVPIP